MSEVGVHRFIAAVSLHFPRPKFSGDETMEGAWVASMTRVLSNCDDALLAEAANIILNERDPKKDGRFFPVPKECKDACDLAAERRDRQLLALAPPKADMPYDGKVRLARDLMKSPPGKQATREGWGEAMFHFCVEHERAPTGNEIGQCKQSARDFKATHEALLKDGSQLGSAWARVAEGMVRKARELMEQSA